METTVLNVCSQILEFFCQSVEASTFILDVVCWGRNISASASNRLKVIRKAGFIFGCKQETYEFVVKRKTLNKLLSFLDNRNHVFKKTMCLKRFTENFPKTV